MDNSVYAIGQQGSPWGSVEKSQWYSKQMIKRSYQEEVVTKLKQLANTFTLKQYGSLEVNEEHYPVFAMLSKSWHYDKKNVLITGGVHGYETSGVQGAIEFLSTTAMDYDSEFNVIVVPCVSPWGYETINRWNHQAIDPNRSFYENSPAQESAMLMALLKELNVELSMHIDLHETTDTDNSEFRPALAARDAVEHTNWNIPDGFYLVADSDKPAAEFQRSIIASVAKVTHIAEADSQGRLIGVNIEQKGVINYQAKPLGLCMGVTQAPYVTTTEVYPDSPLADAKNCVEAQVTAIKAAMDFLT